MLELCLVTRESTGKVWLQVITGETREAIEPIVRKKCPVRSRIWTDGHMRCDWLDCGRATPYRDQSVPHVNREFARTDEATGDVVSTNGVGSLFMRLQKFSRFSGLSNIGRGARGDWLGMYL